MSTILLHLIYSSDLLRSKMENIIYTSCLAKTVQNPKMFCELHLFSSFA